MPSNSSSSTSSRRLLKELEQNSKDPNPNLLRLEPTRDDDLLHWEAVMKGVPESAYEYGLWKLKISVPEAYPNQPPKVEFVTPICHPNVHFKVGGSSRM
jgi:peroxin-4